MKKFFYLSVTPEALIASMIPPVEFGQYYATGQKKRNRGQAIFFEIDPDQIKDLIDDDYIEKRVVSHTDGRPKHTVYLSVYKVLERIPLKAFKNLYLTTDSGVTLELTQTQNDAEKGSGNVLHLYQELCPVTPQIASNLNPTQFLREITDPRRPISLPKLFFVDLNIGELAENPVSGSAEHLPYPFINHLRDCLIDLRNETKKNMKTVQRIFNGVLLYRTIESGFYLGDHDNLLYYRYPSMSEIEEKNFEFARAI